MKKASLSTILSLISTIDTPEADQIREEINIELAKGAEKAQANRALYDQAKEIVLNALALATQPVTVAELYESCAKDLPDGFTKAKVQYALGHYWESEIVKVEGNPNTYAKA